MAGTKQRICYFVHSGSVGGAPLSLLYLLQKIDRTRYEPIVIFLSESPLRRSYEECGIATVVASGMSYFSHTTLEHITLSNPRSWPQVVMLLPSLFQTYLLMRRLRPAIVHINSSTMPAQAVGAKLAGCKVVWHIREPILNGVIGVRRTFLRAVARYSADALVVILNDDVRRMGVPAKSHVVYNFVDFTVFDRSLKRRVLEEQNPRPKRVVMLGGVSEVKGTWELVKAYPLVKQRVGNVQFLIAGYDGKDNLLNRGSVPKRLAKAILRRGQYLRQVHEFVAQHCDSGVVFLGVVDNVPNLLAQADLVVFPSTVPHFPRPIIEAGAMAIPVVASDLEGPREVVRHGETGLLVPPGDSAALAEAISRILVDENLAHAMGEAGYVQASRLFRAEANSQATFAVYDSLLGENAPSAAEKEAGTVNVSARRQPAVGRGIGWLWTVVLLGWLMALFGTYFYKMMTTPGRWEKVVDVLRRLFG